MTKHIWYLFSYETRIWYDYGNLVIENNDKVKYPTWIDAFVLLLKEGRLDRMKLLRETSLAANRNFSKNLSQWFADLFVALGPTRQELVALQPELFSLLNASFSKPVGASLAMLKKIAGEEGFDYQNFLDYLPVLTASPVKTNIAASLSISEAIWKTNKTLAGEIAPLFCGVFIHRDEAIQLRTAKLLTRFAKTASVDISDILMGYSQTLMSAPKTLLRPFMNDDTVKGNQTNANDRHLLGADNLFLNDQGQSPGEKGQSLPQENLHEENSSLQQDRLRSKKEGASSGEPELFIHEGGSLSQTTNHTSLNSSKASIPSLVPIAPVENFEDFVFLLSQVLDNNESWHLDQAAAALLKFQSEFDRDKINQLLPAFQRCWKFLTGGWSSSSGYLDNLFANFMIDVGMVIIKSYPAEARPLRLLYDQSLAKVTAWETLWRKYGTNILFLKSADLKTNEQFYAPYQELLEGVLDHFERKLATPLLSTPTHAPGWVDPNILVERLLIYHKSNIEPNKIDFQLAISRCRVNMVSTETIAALTSLPLAYRNLLAFLFGQDVTADQPDRSEALWAMATITKDADLVTLTLEDGPYKNIYKPLLKGQYPWSTGLEEYKVPKYEYVNGVIKPFIMLLQGKYFVYKRGMIVTPLHLSTSLVF